MSTTLVGRVGQVKDQKGVAFKIDKVEVSEASKLQNKANFERASFSVNTNLLCKKDNDEIPKWENVQISNSGAIKHLKNLDLKPGDKLKLSGEFKEYTNNKGEVKQYFNASNVAKLEFVSEKVLTLGEDPKITKNEGKEYLNVTLYDNTKEVAEGKHKTYQATVYESELINKVKDLKKGDNITIKQGESFVERTYDKDSKKEYFNEKLSIYKAEKGVVLEAKQEVSETKQEAPKVEPVENKQAQAQAPKAEKQKNKGMSI
jgi:hypothetical protein